MLTIRPRSQVSSSALQAPIQMRPRSNPRGLLMKLDNLDESSDSLYTTCGPTPQKLNKQITRCTKLQGANGHGSAPVVLYLENRLLGTLPRRWSSGIT